MSCYEDSLELLKSVRLFKEVDDKTLRKLLPKFSYIKLSKGDVLFYKGDDDFSLYIVRCGMVKAHDGNHTFATFAPGQYFGEYSLLDSTSRSATITALSDTELLCLSQEQFLDMLNKNRNLSGAMIKGLVWRLRDYNVLEAELTAKNREIKKQKEALELQRKELELLNQTKDKFFAIIAHDLRNPFSTVLSLSELLAKEFESFDEEKLRMFITQIYKYSNTTFNLLENLLQWSLMQTGRITVKPAMTNLAELIRENLELLRGSAQLKKVSLTWVNPMDCFAYFDRNMITTVIRNLISNAIKFSNENGKIEIEVQDNTDIYRVIIRDNGVGIPEDVQAKLFNLSSNPTTPGTSKEKGTGLGLVLCREFVEKNSGTIRVKSRVGEGSEFSFTLPRYKM